MNQPAHPHRLLGEILTAEQKLAARDLEQALAAQKQMGGLIGQVLLRLGLVSERDLALALSEQMQIGFAQAEDFPDQALAVEGLKASYLINHNILPLRVENDCLQVVMSLPQDDFLHQALALATGLQIKPLIAAESDLREALQRLYNQPENDTETPEIETSHNTSGEFIEHLKDLASEAPVIQLVNRLIARVIDLRASDIHIEPFEDGLHIRYRIDGILHSFATESSQLAAAVTSRIKLLAQLNIAERRLPQDGRIKTRVKGHELDLRISTLPTVHGESVVLRVLDRANIRLDLENMGFAGTTLSRYRQLITRPHGIVLVTGPTGSGKTTTLYASLARLDAQKRKILTVEDPVEYQLEGVNQVPVQSQIGMSFASALRAILRQDPDIIMIGEMRDHETAQIAVQSALTGHLVLSTLHTNTAAAAIIRLEDMGIERYLITSTINGVLAQRLIRTLCPHCKTPSQPPAAVLKQTGLADLLAASGQTLYAPVGCPQCKDTGYQGRTVVHELFEINSVLHSAILDGADANSLQALAVEHGMRTLYQDGLEKVAAGLTSIEELLRIAHA